MPTLSTSNPQNTSITTAVLNQKLSDCQELRDQKFSYLNKRIQRVENLLIASVLLHIATLSSLIATLITRR